MITAKFIENEKTGDYTINIHGHALSNEEGKDLICACSSGFAGGAEHAITSMYDSGQLEKEPIHLLRKGSAYFVVRPKPVNKVIVYNELLMIAACYEWLASKFPEYVKYIPFGNAEKEA